MGFDFPVGAFAEDGQQRSDLIGAALDQFTRIAGPAIPSQVIIVGDTPRDIAAARQAGCRVLSVATGAYSIAQLQAEHPDAVVPDLSDPKPLYESISLVHQSRHI